MTDLSKLIPMRWPCGVADISEGEGSKSLTAASRELLQRYLDPSLLAVLEGTPVNCLVVNWAAGRPSDAEQQRTLAPLLAKGKAAGLSFIGLVSGDGDRSAALGSARSAGLTAVLMAGEAADAGLPVLPSAALEKVSWTSSSPVLVIDGAVWPGVSGTTGPGSDAGPTSSPWIDSNGWLLRLAQSYAPAKTFWLMFDPPPSPQIVQVESYVRAISDAGSFGGRWVVSLDEKLRAGIVGRESGAVSTWKDISRALELFRRHPDWAGFKAVGVVGVISDFSGENQVLGTEVLNLLTRRNLPYLIAHKSNAETINLERFKAIVCVDAGMPSTALRQRLLRFAEQGGVLLVGQSWRGEGGVPNGQPHPRIDSRTLGKGKFAVCKTDSPDPYMVARDIHALLGRANDLLRFWNIEAFVSRYAAARQNAALLQMTNFSRRGRDERITVWFRERYRSARMWMIGSETAQPLHLRIENHGIEIEIPGVSPYVAIELS